MIVAPSVLSLDFTDTKEQIRRLNESDAAWMHFDVMDGHFVPNLSFGPDILKAFCTISPLFKDVHLMVSDPITYSDVFMEAGADLITFHAEAVEESQIRPLARHIHARGKKAGLSVKPGTPLEVIRPYIHDFDLFLIMSVEPGFGGQKFHPEAVRRIETLRSWIDEEQAQALIEVDGGINEETGSACRLAGCDVLVAGSYVFRNDIRKAVQSLE